MRVIALAVEANKAVRRAAAFLELDPEAGPEFAPSIFLAGPGRPTGKKPEAKPTEQPKAPAPSVEQPSPVTEAGDPPSNPYDKDEN